MADLASLLPPSATEQERDIELSTARLADVPVLVRESWNPDTCPAILLPWLAWAFSVDEWNDDWTEVQQRQVIKDSLYIHKHKGTLAAIERACASIGFTINVTEWFQETPAGTPYTFKIEAPIPTAQNAASIFDEITRLVFAYKNVRSQLTGLTITADIDGTAFIACATISGATVEVLPLITENLENTSSLYLAVSHQAANFMTIYPLET